MVEIDVAVPGAGSGGGGKRNIHNNSNDQPLVSAFLPLCFLPAAREIQPEYGIFSSNIPFEGP